MSPLDASVLIRKLALIEDRLDVLAPIARLSLVDYRADRVRKKGAEQLLQELINAAVDANYHILVESGPGAPPDAFQSFVAMADLGVLPLPLARALAPSAGLRNRLVHDDATLDDARVHAALAEAQQRFPEYVRAVRDRCLPEAG